MKNAPLDGAFFYGKTLDLFDWRDSYVHLLNSTVRSGERDFRDVVLKRDNDSLAELRVADAATEMEVGRIVFHGMAGGL